MNRRVRPGSSSRTVRLCCPLLLAAACGKDPAATDGSASASAGETDTDAAGEGVRMATLVTRLPLIGAPQESSEDPFEDGTEYVIEVGDDDYAGVYDGSAWVNFDGVPEGNYWLHWTNPPSPDLPGIAGSQGFMETDRRELYVGEIRSGRGGVAQSTSEATAITLTASGMTPLSAYDAFELYSYNADAFVVAWPSLDPLDGSLSPLIGDTALGGWRVPWDVYSSDGSRPLVDQTKGDDLWLAHLIDAPLVPSPGPGEFDDPWTYVSTSTLTEAAKLTIGTMSDGQVAAASGDFTAVPQKSLSLDLRTAEFVETMLPGVPPGAQVDCDVTVYVEPGVELPVYGYTPTLFELTVSSAYPVPPKNPGDRALSIEYGNPYPIGTEMLYVRCHAFGEVYNPNDEDTDTVYDQIGAGFRIDGLNGGPIGPRVGPVQGLTVNGASIPHDGEGIGIGTTPTIAFSPPLLGQPDYYVVSLRTLDDVHDAEGNRLSRQRTIASFSTRNTSLTVPSGLLELGKSYVIVVSAAVGIEPGAGQAYTHEGASSRVSTGLCTP